MNIKNASQRVISNEVYVNTKVESAKVPQAERTTIKDTFENSKSSESNQGKKELGFDQERMSAAVDTNVGKPAYEIIDGEKLSQNQPTDKNPYGPGVMGQKEDPLEELRNKVNEDRQKAREGSQEPTGPNIGPVIDQFLSGEVNVETENSKKAEQDRLSLRNGATGNALLAEASEQKDNSPAYGKDMISQSGGAGYAGTVGYKDGEGVKGGSGKAAKENPGLNQAVKDTYINGGKGSAREYGLLSSEPDFNPKDYKTSDGTRVQTGNDGTVVETSPDGTKKVTKPDGSSTTVSPDGSYVDKDKDGKTTDKGSVKMPDQDHQYTAPNLPGFQNPTAGVVVHRNGSGDGGNIDYDPSAAAKGPVYDDAQIHLNEIGKHGMIGQPDTTFQSGSGSGMAGTSQQGADIDMGSDSNSQGYAGNTQAEEPGDVNFNVGGQVLVGIESKEDKKSKEEEDKSLLKKISYRRIQA